MIENVECVDYDLSKNMFGLEKSNYIRLAAITNSIIHCASDTSFSECRREKVIESNINGLAEILKFVSQEHVKYFYYISTAYVAGITENICKEKLPSADKYTNVYEESKAHAEKIIAEYCETKSIRYSIIRPSIVYGDSSNGRSLKFNALYFPIRSIKNIRDIYLNDLKNNGGKKSEKCGIYINDQGYMKLPLRIHLPRKGAINLIPVDYFVNASMTIIDNPHDRGIYHLTNNIPTKMETLAAYNEIFMKIRGVEILYGNHNPLEFRNPAEELFERFIEPYRPYLSDNRIFERVNTDLVTDKMHPPEFTFEIFKNCMEYAISVNWGESIFADENMKSHHVKEYS
jgi:nucleoside-diphosphate-sugar epimerase